MTVDLRRGHATTVRTEGGLLPADLLAKIAANDADVPGLAEADFGLPGSDRIREAITRSWNRLVGSWAALTAARVTAGPTDSLTTATRERFLLPLFDELGFGRLAVARSAEFDSVPISHVWQHVPIHLIAFDVEVDRRTSGVKGAAGAAPHALVQELLNRSDAHLWGIVSNGRVLRLLRDSTSLTRQAFVEFDLEAIFEGELYADFALLWLVCHRTRFEGAQPADCLLERWMHKSADDGTRALDKLRGGVERAIETLGSGFVAHPANTALRDALRSGDLNRQDYYRELLRLVYRLIFLFTAEDRRDETTGRELLLDPNASEAAAARYRAYYSTARLRSLAQHRRGTRHSDLWAMLRRVALALGSDGAATIALPALGSFLFGAQSCPHLDSADLSNEALLRSVRALATIEENGRLRVVDYRNLGAEELGGIYESLLELHPQIEIAASPPRFTLSAGAGNERKSTGSYYTPSSLISCLLDSALDPAIDAALDRKRGQAAEEALLGLSIVDPAAGSGHFLVAAAHRLAKRLAAIRTGDVEPSPSAVRRALRDVISRCVYAVDVNAMAVELCKVSLWLEALEPGRPLTFLDAHIKAGNSLLGTVVDLVEEGVPDEAFVALTGDDKAIVRAQRDRNRRERAGQRSLIETGLHSVTDELAAVARALDELPEEDVAAVAAKAARHQAFLEGVDYDQARLALDAWCAAFVAPKTQGTPEITTAVVRALGAQPQVVADEARRLVETLRASYHFFHWELEFPQVASRGGFSVVLGNPPWERVKLQEKEFFAERSPAIAGAKNAAARKRLIADLPQADPMLWQTLQDARRRAEGDSHLLRNSGAYPLAGRGDINTFAVFTELARRLTAEFGWMGVIVPSAVATDETTSLLFRSFVDGRSLRSLYDFRNSDAMFKGVGHARFKFCLLTVGPVDSALESDMFFFAITPDDLADRERHVTLGGDDFALLNPNTRTCPTLRSRTDADLMKSIYRRVPVLIRDGDTAGNAWRASFLRMFDMANDSGLFRDVPGDDTVPLYEAKMVHQFDHRYGDYALRPPGSLDTELPRVPAATLEDPDFSPRPRYWVRRSAVEERLGSWDRRWLLGWRDIARATDERTMIAAVLPRFGVGHKFPLLLSEAPPAHAACLLANLNSLVLDYVVRQKLGGIDLTYTVLEQLPVLPPDAYDVEAPWAATSVGAWLRPYVIELCFTSWAIAPMARDAGYGGAPFVWRPERREILRAELDAAFLHLYGLCRNEASTVLDSFPIVRDGDVKRTGAYRTRELVLDAFDAIASASLSGSIFRSRLSPEPGSAAATHEPRGATPDGRWSPWHRAFEQQGTERAQTLEPPLQLASETPPSLPWGRGRSVTVGRHVQGTLGMAASHDGDWVSELEFDPVAIVLGTRVRHRTRGVGTILTVKRSGRSTELLIRFEPGGEAWIAFGYGVLEFAR